MTRLMALARLARQRSVGLALVTLPVLIAACNGKGGSGY